MEYHQEVSSSKTRDQNGLNRSPKLSGRNDLSFSTCVRTLSNVSISRRGLLQLEMSVGLAVFMDFGTANRAAKQMLSDIYVKAGYDCQDTAGKDYKTVNRRIQASSALFGKLTPDTISEWVKNKKENKLLQAIAYKLSEFNFKSMDDILDYVGRTSNRKGPSAPSPYDISMGEGLIVHLPKRLTEGQLIELASKIITLAETLSQSQAAEASQAQERRFQSISVQHDRRAQSLH